ncbi:MAG: glutamate racemase [Candidatus Omnitrophota bacterium]
MKLIGVFDSGVGGLTVVKELIKQLPSESLIYFGDTARVPYGAKSKETVTRFSIENALFLSKHNVKLICVACNTASSCALPKLRKKFSVPIVGVINPGAKEAVYTTKNNRIGVIGTKGTIKSRAYEDEIKRLNPKIKVFSTACPLFVPFVEEGWLNQDVVLTVAKKYLQPLKDARVDTLILGCTHYPLLKKVIKKVMGKKVVLIDSAKEVAIEVKKILSGKGLLNKRGKGRVDFFVSDNPEWFKGLTESFLGKPLKKVKKVDNV